MKTFPTIETDRLILRQPTSLDIPVIVRLANDPDIADGTLNMPHPYLEKNAIFWINMSYQGFDTGEQFIFAVELKETRSFIGGTGFTINKRFNRAEIGYWIGKQYWNKGYCTESLSAILKFGFNDLKLNKFIATHFPHNPSSGKVMQKCGMIKEGELVQHVKKDDGYLDMIQYRLTRNEFEKINLL